MEDNLPPISPPRHLPKISNQPSQELPQLTHLDSFDTTLIQRIATPVPLLNPNRGSPSPLDKKLTNTKHVEIDIDENNLIMVQGASII